MLPSNSELAALLIAISFAAGLNVYATVAVLGVFARLHWIDLPGQLDMLANWWVIGASTALFVIEFVLDKIPYIDLAWNALQTFVRVPVAGFLAYAATPNLGPGWQIVAVTAGSAIALAVHGGKTAARAVVSPSPEPVSNAILSTVEDVFVVFLLWFATEHPFLAAIMALVFLSVIIVFIRFVWLALRALFRGARKGRLAEATHN